MKTKIESYLGFAKKSGNLVAGFHTCESAIKKRKVKLLIICEDTAGNSMEKIIGLAKAGSTPYRIFGHSDVLGPAAGNPGRTIFAITGGGFEQPIRDEIDRMKPKSEDRNSEKEVQ